MRIKNKTIFITGGGVGIGLATSKKLLREGANVVIFSHGVNPFDKLREYNKNVLFIKGDVTKREQVRNALKKGIKKFGSIDVLINNAGVAKRENFLKTKEKDWDFVIGVNIKGVLTCIQEFIKTQNYTERPQKNTENKIQYKSVGSPHRSVIVVNISSGAGEYGVEEIAVYSATKAAVINISQSLQEELKNYGVKFATICPGATDTKMFANLFPEESPQHTPEQVAEVIYKTIIGKIKPDERLIVDPFRHITNADLG